MRRTKEELEAERQLRLAAARLLGLTHRITHAEFMRVAMRFYEVHPHAVVFVEEDDGMYVLVKDEHAYKAALALVQIVDKQE